MGLGFLNGQAGDLFQHLQLALFDGGDFFLLLLQLLQLLAELFLLGLDIFILPVDGLFLLLDAALLLLDLGAALLTFLFIFGPGAENFFPGLYDGFAFFGFCGLDGVVDDLLCFILGTADLFFCNFFPIKITCKNTCGGDNK